MRALGIAQPNNHHQTAAGEGTSSSSSAGSGPKIIDAGTITLPKPILGGGNGGGGGNGHASGGNGASSLPATSSSSSVPKVASAAPPTGQDSSAQDTIYLCNFRVSVDGEWLCLKELNDLDLKEGTSGLGGGGYGPGNGNGGSSGAGGCDGEGSLNTFGLVENVKSEEKTIERDWVNYYCSCYLWNEPIIIVILLIHVLFSLPPSKPFSVGSLPVSSG